ncbi:MAG: hypothetical protein JKY24_08620 [Pseudomonadales bacterium]|nr:hypothetical protein [Pseudomonadales bacterium]
MRISVSILLVSFVVTGCVTQTNKIESSPVRSTDAGTKGKQVAYSKRFPEKAYSYNGINVNQGINWFIGKTPGLSAFKVDGGVRYELVNPFETKKETATLAEGSLENQEENEINSNQSDSYKDLDDGLENGKDKGKMEAVEWFERHQTRIPPKPVPTKLVLKKQQTNKHEWAEYHSASHSIAPAAKEVEVATAKHAVAYASNQTKNNEQYVRVSNGLINTQTVYRGKIKRGECSMLDAYRFHVVKKTGKIKQATYSTIKVTTGDSLWKISGSAYSAPALWPIVYAKNTNVIGNNPNRIKPGQELAIDKEITLEIFDKVTDDYCKDFFKPIKIASVI